VPSLANEIDDSPALLPTLQALQRKFRKLTPAQTTPEQDGQDRSITLSGQSLSIGYLPESRRLAYCKPVAQTRAQLANSLNPMDAGGQFRAQQSTIGCLVRQASHGRHSHIDCPGSQAALFQMEPMAQYYCFVEGQSRFRTVPGDELVDGILISAR